MRSQAASSPASSCKNIKSGLMLVVVLWSGHMFTNSAFITSETRHSCPARKYTEGYDNNHNSVSHTEAELPKILLSLGE